MKNKFNRMLCTLLAPCIVLLSGCSNENKVNKNNNTNNDNYSSEVDSSTEDEQYDNVVVFKAYDELNDINRYYFTTNTIVEKLPKEKDFAYAIFGQYVPLEVLEKSQIRNYMGEFKGIVNQNVTIVNHAVGVISEEGYNCSSYLLSITDTKNNLKITQYLITISLNNEIILKNNIYIIDDGKRELHDDKTSIEMIYSVEELTYEEILELDNYYNKANENNKTKEENILKRV